MNHKQLFAMLLMFMATVMGVAAQQTIQVKGTVVDEDGEPIMGATVEVVGSQIRDVTNIDGQFTFPSVSTKYKDIEVRFVGMEPAKVKIAPTLDIVLKQHSEMMDEVVVVAYGKQKREAFTGSAAVVKGDELVKRAANNPIAALDGKVPGMTMLQANNPTSENTINIRGLGSINASNAPLIILDGQPYNGSWRDINPADVDNISVLKDASSNALYGARGANGVIMITTKSASRDRTRVTLDVKIGANTDALRDYDIIDSAPEYYEAHYQALRNYNQRVLGMSAAQAHLAANATMTGTDTDAGGLGYIIYSVPQGQTLIGSNGKLNPSARLGNRVYNNGQYYTLYPDNWRDNGIRTGLRQDYNLTISGGNEKQSNYFSLGYLSDEGISYGSNLERFTARMKVDYKAFEWLRIGGNANYSHSNYNNMNNAFETCHNIAPIYPLYMRDQYGQVMTDARGPMYDYGDGTLGFVRVVEKNLNAIQSDKLDKSKRSSNAFGMTGYAHFDFLRDFRLSLNAGIQETDYRDNSAYNPYYGYYANIGGSISSTHARRTTYNFQQLLNYSHAFGPHNVDVLLGHEYNRYTTTTLSASRNTIAIFEQNTELDGAIVNSTMDGSRTMYNVEGYFIRGQYDYDSRIFASASFRRDGSSRFHPDHRWGNFWSVGGAWMLTKEEWFPKSDIVNQLKFKLSYGQQGNDGLASSFYWVDYYSIENSNGNVGYSFSWKGNPDITWETTGNLNTGFEFSFFNSRLNGSLEYYNRKTSDMLYFKNVPSSLGYSGYYDNVGDMVNNGVELTLNAVPVRSRDFTWSIDLNMAFEKNKVTYLPENSRGLKIDGHSGYQSGYYYNAEGLPLYTWYIPRYAGANPETGQPTWYVKETDGSLSTTTNYDRASYFICGTALPDAYGGFGTSLSYRGFDLSANFTFTIGGKKLDNGYLSLMGSPYGSSIGLNIHRDALTGWSEANPDAYLPRWQYNDTQNNLTSDFYLIDASQLTFKSCQVGYTLPASLTRSMAMQSARVYFSVDNVYYWTKRQGFDPRGGRTTFNGTGYSPMRTFMGGLNIVF